MLWLIVAEDRSCVHYRRVFTLLATQSRPSAACRPNEASDIIHTLTGSLVAHCHNLSCPRRDAAQIPWGDAGADVICESTGVYTTIDKVIVKHRFWCQAFVVCRQWRNFD